MSIPSLRGWVLLWANRWAAWRRTSGEAYRAFLEAAISKPYMVGKHRCTYIDDIPTRNYRRPGLLRDDDSPYTTLIELTVAANRDALASLYGTARATKSKTGKSKP